MKKSLIGAIGEQMVSVKLMQQGWNVLNANASITNFESIDLVCINPETDGNIPCSGQDSTGAES